MDEYYSVLLSLPSLLQQQVGIYQKTEENTREYVPLQGLLPWCAYIFREAE